jgi:general secretion pathway protein N
MRRVGAPALVLALLATGAAAQEPARESVILPIQPALNVPLAGNPLWAIALDELSETSARPIFSTSRRPPAPPLLAALAAAPVRPSPPAKPGSDHPLLTLLGTIVGDSLEIGIFTDEVSQDVVRLKAGEAHDGWTLSAVSGHAAIFQKQGYPAATLAFPAPGTNANAASLTFAPPIIPATTKGESKRPPREG